MNNNNNEEEKAQKFKQELRNKILALVKNLTEGCGKIRCKNINCGSNPCKKILFFKFILKRF